MRLVVLALGLDATARVTLDVAADGAVGTLRAVHGAANRTEVSTAAELEGLGTKPLVVEFGPPADGSGFGTKLDSVFGEAAELEKGFTVVRVKQESPLARQLFGPGGKPLVAALAAVPAGGAAEFLQDFPKTPWWEQQVPAAVPWWKDPLANLPGPVKSGLEALKPVMKVGLTTYLQSLNTVNENPKQFLPRPGGGLPGDAVIVYWKGTLNADGTIASSTVDMKGVKNLKTLVAGPEAEAAAATEVDCARLTESECIQEKAKVAGGIKSGRDVVQEQRDAQTAQRAAEAMNAANRAAEGTKAGKLAQDATAKGAAGAVALVFALV